jgi:hypothetical protein
MNAFLVLTSRLAAHVKNESIQYIYMSIGHLRLMQTHIFLFFFFALLTRPDFCVLVLTPRI